MSDTPLVEGIGTGLNCAIGRHDMCRLRVCHCECHDKGIHDLVPPFVADEQRIRESTAQLPALPEETGFDPEKVERYEPQGQYDYEGMGVQTDGNWVCAEDYDELLALYAALSRRAQPQDASETVRTFGGKPSKPFYENSECPTCHTRLGKSAVAVPSSGPLGVAEVLMCSRCAFLSKVRTSHVSPPIPTRKFDWAAWMDGHEEDGSHEYGETKEEAVHNLQSALGISFDSTERIVAQRKAGAQ